MHHLLSSSLSSQSSKFSSNTNSSFGYKLDYIGLGKYCVALTWPISSRPGSSSATYANSNPSAAIFIALVALTNWIQNFLAFIYFIIYGCENCLARTPSTKKRTWSYWKSMVNSCQLPLAIDHPIREQSMILLSTSSPSLFLLFWCKPWMLSTSILWLNLIW